MHAIAKNVFSTESNNAAVILRIILGAVLFAHGAQNMIGWFGGSGFSATMEYLTGVAGLPFIVALSVISLQFFGALLIIVGLTTRVMALGILGMFIGMIVTVHYEFGFFMNWFGTNSGEGYEYHLLVMGIAAALLVMGGGAWSVDQKLADLLK